MKRELNDWEKSVVAAWDKTFAEIVSDHWKLVESERGNINLGINMPEDIRIAFLTLFGGANGRKALHEKINPYFLDDNSIYELVTGTSKDGYTIEEGLALIKFFFSSFWGYKHR